ncbi:putative transcription regulator, AraC family protein [Aliidongia dinghuensis]|uniref:Putative transcription regulator, AraC family protein n=1 Tax=Aliidongia dinghuensis TaxID=1867774 RepID=A0A8J3E683_9PROT|nr:helix-turn-helix domain-containing protein [Aliidongia dinghuensis]GGF27770.1 putative transcription regulator, AraC family protein [Aliidongia dinghuensis]
MHIHVLALDGVFDTGLATVLDAFGIANALAEMTGVSSLRFQTTVVGLAKTVTTAQGLSMPVTAAARAETPDVVVMPAINRIMPDPLMQALASGEVREAGAVLRKWSGLGAQTAAACVGTFVLAEAALLDGEQATTTWWLAPLFRQRYPQVQLDETRLIVQSNAVVTAGAALGHLDLALTLIRRASPELASVTAKYLVADTRTSQAAYTIPGHLVHTDPLVHKFERWARERLAEGFSLDQAAAALATSKRTLARRMQGVLGKSPLDYFQDLRIQRAVHLLETSQASVDQIAAEVGYAEGVTLRVLLRRKLGRGVREIRRSL